MRLAALGLLLLGLIGCASAPSPDELLPPVKQPLRSEAEYQRLQQQALTGVVKVNELTGLQEFAGPTEYVIMSDFQFTPDILRFRSGTIVRVRLSNTALVTHYFGGEEFFRLGADTVNLQGSLVPKGQHHIPVNPLTDRDIYLFLKDPGTYLLDCFVPNHRIAGMIGQIIVEP